MACRIAVSASAFDPHGYYSSDYSFAGLMPMTKHVRDRDLTVYVPLRAILLHTLGGRGLKSWEMLGALGRLGRVGPAAERGEQGPE